MLKKQSLVTELANGTITVHRAGKNPKRNTSTAVSPSAELLRASVREYASALGKSVAASEQGTSLDKMRSLMPSFAAGGALEVEPIADNSTEFLLNVRRCGYAEYFRSLGEPEFGAMLACEIDPPITEAIGDDLSLDRTQTIMSGGDHCDFRWKLSD